DPAHDPRGLQVGEVPVDRALRHAPASTEDLRDRHRAPRTGQDLDQPAAAVGGALPRPVQPDGGLLVDRRWELAPACSSCRNARGAARLPIETTANTAAAASTIAPLAAMSKTNEAVSPATTDAAPIATESRSVERNERASSCAVATGSTISA